MSYNSTLNHQHRYNHLEKQLTELGFDGAWSLLTRLIIKMQPQSPQISINKNWVITSQSFKCPVCERKKPSIAQISRKGIHLVLHIDHDHYFLGLLENSNLKKNLPSKIINQAVTKYQCFSPIIICADCNQIDARLKRRFPLPSHLTLTPSLKKRVLNPSKNKHHRLDYSYFKENIAKIENDYHKRLQLLQDELSAIETDYQDLSDHHKVNKNHYHRKHQTFKSISKNYLRLKHKKDGWINFIDDQIDDDHNKESFMLSKFSYRKHIFQEAKIRFNRLFPLKKNYEQLSFEDFLELSVKYPELY